MRMPGRTLALICSLLLITPAWADGIVNGGSGGGSSSGANPTGTAGPVAVDGSAATFLRSDGAPAVQKGTNAQFGVVEGDTSTITCVAGVCSVVSAGGTVTSISAGCAASTGGSAITTTGTIAAVELVDAAGTGSNYAIPGSDCGYLVDLSNSGAQTPTIAQAGTGVFTAGWFADVCNIGVGTQKLTPVTSTIGGLASWAITTSQCYRVVSDGTNYQIVGSWALAPLATGSSTGNTLTAPDGYFVCTAACTVTPPVPAAGYQFCVMNDDNVSSIITLGAIGSSAYYEKTARTGYGTAGTGTLTSAGAVGDMICIVGRDSTHYLSPTYVGTWTTS
jgi:hypothetical protein